MHRCGLSLNQIGQVLARDHTTILHAVRKVAADPTRARQVERACGLEVGAGCVSVA
jgi:chromosomal replication initiation ATPase DnaA